MKKHTKLSRNLLGGPLAAALLVVPGWLGAQTAPAASAAASTAASDEAIKLNPFEVVDEKDGTFQSNNIGTGSRLALDLKDAPVPYSIINREFIDALGITDLKEAAAWATGNTFYKTDNGSDSRGLAGQYQSRGNVTGNVTATNAPDNYGTQRNFYQNASISGDSYAVESYDFGRGPNAALFGQGAGTGGGDAGNGGLAGVNSVQTKRARLDAIKTTVGVEIGSWKYHRVTLDYNRPITDRLGVRLNLVDLDKAGWRMNDKQATRGISLAGTYKLNTGGDLRLDLSNEKRDQHTVGTGWDEFISGWDGATVFRGPMTNSMRSTNATAGLTSVANGSYGTLQTFGNAGLTWNGESQGTQLFNGGNPHYLYNTSDGTVMNWQNFMISRRADNTSRTPLWTTTAPNGAAFVRADLPLQGNGQAQPAFGVGRSFFAEGNLPKDMFNRAIQNSAFRIPSQRFNSSADIPLVSQISRDAQLTYTQQVGTNLFFELGADANRNNNTNRNLDDPNPGGRSAYLDLNQIRPDGSPNSNFLQPFSTVPMVQRLNTTSDRTLRLNTAYVLNAGVWGSYNFNVQGSASQRKSVQREYQISVKANADPRNWGGGNDQIKEFMYWNDAARGWKEPINGTTVRFTDVDWTNANNPVMAPLAIRQPAWVLTNWGESFIQSRYYTVQATAKYWEEKIVFTGAYRRDLNFGNSKSGYPIGGNTSNRGVLPANWDGITPIYRPDAPADYFSMTYVNKNPTTGAVIGAGIPLLALTRPTSNNAFGVPIPLAVYSGERFRDDYNNPTNRSYANNKSYGVVYHVTKQFSLLANFADSYTPRSSITQDMTYAIREPQMSKSRDVGFTWNLFNNRLTGKYNYYVQTRQNDSANALTGINSLFQANDATNADTTASGRNIRGFQDFGNGVDYQDRRNFGSEVDLAFNPTRALRFTANGTTGSYSLDNIQRLNKAYVPAHAADFLQILQDAGGMLDTSQKPVGAPNAPGLAVINSAVTPASVADRDMAVASFNTIYVNYQTLLTQRTVRVSLPRSANVFADYTLQTGVAKGLRIGMGVQWQKALIGARNADTTLDAAGTSAIAFPGRNGDLSSRLWGNNNYVTQMNLAYSFKLKDGNPLSVSLRINNFLNDRSKIYGDNGVFGGAGFPGTNGLRSPTGDLTKPNRENSPYVLSDIHEPINARLTASYTFGSSRSR